MKLTKRHILTALLLFCLAAYISVFLGISAGKRHDTVCAGLRVTVLDSTKNSFVSADEIRSHIRRGLGEVTGKPTDSLDLTEIESLVDGKSAVKKSEAFITSDGYLNIDVSQREPAIRFQGKRTGFYADSEGYLFPLQKSHTPNVMIVDGYIPVDVPDGYKGIAETEEERAWIRKILDLMDFMEQESGWADAIVQISVQKNGDIIMVPREGKEKFNFGKPEDIEEKFRKIEKYYTSVKPSREDGYYSTVNVKYSGQIICRR